MTRCTWGRLRWELPILVALQVSAFASCAGRNKLSRCKNRQSSPECAAAAAASASPGGAGSFGHVIEP